jgi:hypothetical protein
MVLPAGVEPATLSLGRICSIQLSYGSGIWIKLNELNKLNGLSELNKLSKLNESG